MTNPFARKLENFMRLSPADRQTLDGLVQKLHRRASHEDIVPEDGLPGYVNVLMEGWACRYKTLEDGRRQIVAFLLPGDLCDPHVFALGRMGHALGTLTPVALARLSEPTIKAVTASSPDLAEAFQWDMIVNAEIQREWAVSLGRRTAKERLAHLFCEIATRLGAVGLTSGPICDMPITQADLGDAMGLSSVHVNRTLQELRATGLVELRGKRLTITDFERLRELAMFNPTYLHLGGRAGRFGAQS